MVDGVVIVVRTGVGWGSLSSEGEDELDESSIGATTPDGGDGATDPSTLVSVGSVCRSRAEVSGPRRLTPSPGVGFPDGGSVIGNVAPIEEPAIEAGVVPDGGAVAGSGTSESCGVPSPGTIAGVWLPHAPRLATAMRMLANRIATSKARSPG